MIHAIITLIFCIIVLVLKLPLALVFITVGFYVGRKHAQAEYRYIEAHGGKRSACPWWMGFASSAWTAKGLLDFLLPFAAASGAVLASFLLGR